MGSVMLWGYEGTLWYYGWAPFDPTCPAGLEALDAKIKEAQNLATKIIEANYESRVQRFSNWVKEQSVGGAGALHKFVKPRMAWSPHGAYQGPEGVPPTLQATVDAEAKTWRDLWNSCGNPTPPEFPSEIPSMPRISPDAVRRASLAFCPRTGVGGDHIHPRWFATLSEVSL